MLASVSASGQSIPRLADGKPDFNGIWDRPRILDITRDSNACGSGAPTKGCVIRSSGRTRTSGSTSNTKDESGTVTRWQCEGGSPNTLTRQGWSRDSLKPGQQVSIEGFRAKNGSNTCNSRVVTTADGKRLFAGSSFGQ